MSRQLTDAEIDKLDAGESAIIDTIEAILGVKCDYVNDNMNEIVHDIFEQIAEWGEEVKKVPESQSYPYVESDEDEEDKDDNVRGR